MNSTKPIVTVICATYNHAPYIGEALASFASQETSFPFQVLVGDDASTDTTPSIIMEYAQRYPGLIVPVIREGNIGAGRNWEDLIGRTRSPYLAFCDGDDYWSDTHKLQKQYDLLESNPNLRACFHDTIVSIETEDGTWFQKADFSHTPDGSCRWPSGNPRFRKRATYDLVNYIPFGFVHTSSMFIRWDFCIALPDWYFGHGLGDYPLWALQVNTGRFAYIDEAMSVHRRTDSGSFAFTNRMEFWRDGKRAFIPLLEGLIDFFTNEKPSQKIVEACKRRQRMELGKILAGTESLDGPEAVWKRLVEYAPAIKRHCDIRIPAEYSAETYREVMAAISKRIPIPPYTQSVRSLIRHRLDSVLSLRDMYH